MLLICSGAVPAFRTDVVNVAVLPTATFPNRRFAGLTTAAGTPAAARVVPAAGADSADSFPGPSPAATWYRCVDEGGSPVSANVVAVCCGPTGTVAPSRYTRQPAAPVTALHETFSCVELAAVALTPAGAAGGVWSAGGGASGAAVATRPWTVMRF